MHPETICGITGMDLTVDTEAFGGTVNYSEKQAPNIKVHSAKTKEDILAPAVENENLQAYYEACREYNAANGVETVIDNEQFMVK